MKRLIYTRAISTWLIFAFLTSFQLLPLLHALDDGGNDSIVNITKPAESHQHRSHQGHCAICDRISSTQVAFVHTFSHNTISFVREILGHESFSLPPLLNYTIKYGRAPPAIS